MSYITYQHDDPTTDIFSGSEPPKRGFRLNLPAMGCLALVGFGVWFFVTGKTSIDSEDLAYLPDDANLVVQLNVEQMCESELFENLKPHIASMLPVRSADDFAQMLQGFEKKVERVTFGIKMPNLTTPRIEPSLAGVIHTKHDLAFRDLIPAKAQANLREETIGGKKLITSAAAPGVNIGICQIDSRTIAVGTVDVMRQVLGRKGTSAKLSPAMEEALDEADFSRVLTMAAVVPQGYMSYTRQPVELNSVKALVIEADIDADIHLSTTLVMQDSSSAEKLKSTVEAFTQLMNGQTCAQAAILDSFEISQTGATVTASAIIPGRLVMESTASQSRAFASVAGSKMQSCLQNVAKIHAAMERYYFENDRWPTLDELDGNASYFPDGVPRTCPVDNSQYTIDPSSHRIIGHTHQARKPRSAVGRRSSTAATSKRSICKFNKAMLNSTIERYYFEQGSYPGSIDDLVEFSLDEVPTCPVDRSPYTIDSDSHLIHGHVH